MLLLKRGGNAVNFTQLRATVSLISKISNGLDGLGVNWISRFIDRHPEIHSKIGRKLDYQRAQAVTIDNIQHFFVLLQSLITQFNIKGRRDTRITLPVAQR